MPTSASFGPPLNGNSKHIDGKGRRAGPCDLFKNLKHLLLQAPVKDKAILGFDPAYRTGCKLAVIDSSGRLLDHAVCYPTPPQNAFEESKKLILALIERHNVDVISLGNGTASRESERFLAEILKDAKRPVSYVVVSEAGASVYSASKLAAEEFPDLDVSFRGAVSIARRLQDPLAELVKIDPKALGVGQYQHDVNQKKLSEKLAGVVEDCVNSVGVDVNTASPSLLSYVSGITASVANSIVKYREENGLFKSREEFLSTKARSQDLQTVRRISPGAGKRQYPGQHRGASGKLCNSGAGNEALHP